MEERVRTYRCYFYFEEGIEYYVDYISDVNRYKGIQKFNRGFWITTSEQGPKLDVNGNIWVPPASITYITYFDNSDGGGCNVVKMEEFIRGTIKEESDEDKD